MHAPLSVTLSNMVRRASEKPRTLNELLAGAGEYGVDLVIIVLALPFCLPILPGISAPFGLAIIILAFRQIIDRPGRLPKYIGDRKFAPTTFEKIINSGVKILNRIDRFSSHGKNSLPGLVNPYINGLLILLMALIMALPIPFPGTNTFPAWAIVFLAGAQAEGDGILVLWGYASVLITVIYFWLCWKWMWWLTLESFEFLTGNI